MFSRKALEPIIGQETTSSRFEHAVLRFKAEKAKENAPKIVWVKGIAYAAGTEPRQ